MAPSAFEPEYAKFTKGTPVDGIFGIVQDLSEVMMPAPGAGAPVIEGPNGMMAAVHTSFGDRNKLKSSTSALFLPSTKRTLTAFVDTVVLTTDSSELYGLTKLSARTV